MKQRESVERNYDLSNMEPPILLGEDIMTIGIEINEKNPFHYIFSRYHSTEKYAKELN